MPQLGEEKKLRSQQLFSRGGTNCVCACAPEKGDLEGGGAGTSPAKGQGVGNANLVTIVIASTSLIVYKKIFTLTTYC